LTRAGYHVDAAANGREAAAFFAKHSYDLVTLDFNLPGVDGAHLHRTLSKAYGFGQRLSPLLPQRLPPILIITGFYDEKAVQEMIFGERVVGVLQKPIDLKKFTGIVGELLEWERVRRAHRARALERLGVDSAPEEAAG